MPVASGGTVPISTPQWSEAQVEAWNRREAERQRWIGRPVKHAAEYAREQAAADAERDRREAAERHERWGEDPRTALRQAHQALQRAIEETARRRAVAAGAQAHLDECRTRAEELERVGTAQAERAVSDIRQALENGRQIADAVGDAELAHELSAAKQDVGYAERALADLAATVTKAEAAEAAAQAAITGAAEAVIAARALEIADRIVELQTELAGLRGQLRGLDILWVPGVRPRPIKLPRQVAALFPTTSPAGSEARWAAALKGLQSDPEAPLPD
jgi:hypothetical protein